MSSPNDMERPKQPTVTVEDIIAVVEASHHHLVQEINNNHNHMMTTVENHHKHLINGLKYDPMIASYRRNNANNLLCKRLQNPSSTAAQKDKASVHTGTETGSTKATMMATRAQATSTIASATTTRASQATTESGSQRSNSPHDSNLSQREQKDSSPDFTWDDEL